MVPKGSYIPSILREVGGLGLFHQNLAARRDAELAVNDDLLARRDSFLDDDHLTLPLPHRHRSHLCSRVVLDDINELPLGRHLRRRGGDQDGPAQNAQDEPDVDEAAWPKPAIAVGYSRPQIHRPGRVLHRVVHERQGADDRFIGFVGQSHFGLQRAMRHVSLHRRQIVLRNREIGVDGVQSLDYQERRPDAEGRQIADVYESLPGATIDRGVYEAITQLQFGVFDRRLVRLDRLLSVAHRRLVSGNRGHQGLGVGLHLLELVVRDDSLPVQLRVSPRLRLAEFRLRSVTRQGRFGLFLQRQVFGQIGLGLLKTNLKRARIDGEEQIAFLYVGAVGKVEIHNSPGDLGPNLDHFPRDTLADLIQVNRHVLSHRSRDGYRRRRTVERHLLLLPTSRAQKSCYGHQYHRPVFLLVYIEMNIRRDSIHRFPSYLKSHCFMARPSDLNDFFRYGFRCRNASDLIRSLLTPCVICLSEKMLVCLAGFIR